MLSVLSSRPHVLWSINSGNWLGVGNDPVYAKTKTFNPFPFPATKNSETLGKLGSRIDAFRKERIAEHGFLTMTALYNVLERGRELENGCDVPTLSAKERDIHEAGLVSVLKDIHDDIDRAVFEAYGWADLIPALVGKPGATMPSPQKAPEQEEAEEEFLSRLVALNEERTAEERRGLVRWLRPDYQIPKLGHKVRKPDDVEQLAAQLVVPVPACCSARSLDADRRGKVLIRSDSGGSNDDAEQQAGTRTRSKAGSTGRGGRKSEGSSSATGWWERSARRLIRTPPRIR